MAGRNAGLLPSLGQRRVTSPICQGRRLMLPILLMGLSLTIGQPGPITLPAAPPSVPPVDPAARVRGALQPPVPTDEIKANGNDKSKKSPYPSAIFGPHMPDGPQGRGFIASLVRAY